MSSKKTSKTIQRRIDISKCENIDKKYSHHLIKFIGNKDPLDFAVCTDGTEIPYGKVEQKHLMKIRKKENFKIL